jgi:hypothetical protein
MENLGLIIGQTLYLFFPLLPGVLLCAAAVRYDFWHWLKRPLDGGATFRGRRVFGDNKTWRGIVCMVIGCVAAVFIQKHLIGANVGELAVINYEEANAFLLGAMLGLGVMLGELPNSFVKRQLAIAPGKRAGGVLGIVFYVLDQIDLLFTAWPLLLFWIRPNWLLIATSFVLILVLHQLISLIGYLIGVRQTAF